MTDSVQFRNNHRPTLVSGKYHIKTTLNVSIATVEVQNQSFDAEFWVAGERFHLQPTDSPSVYPPEGNQGVYGNCLPHILLQRDTLPWERSANSAPKEAPPWLCLVLIHENEQAQCTVKEMELSAYVSAQIPDSKSFDYELNKQDEIIQVVCIKQDLAKQLLPSVSQLTRLCHVRATLDKDILKSSVASVVCGRAPIPGKNTVYLASVENRYNDTGFDFPQNSDPCLVVLKSWSFVCSEAPSDSVKSDTVLATLMQNIKPDFLQLPPVLTGDAASDINDRICDGLVALKHQFRSGESGASWYAGPLRPYTPGSRNHPKVLLPAASSDALLWYDNEIGMLDISYAAAWELGRLLAMQNPVLLSQLKNIYSNLRRYTQTQANDSHLPQVHQAKSLAAPEPSAELCGWLEGFWQLRGIPFNYLVAHEKLLPNESVRIFSLDPNWIAALQDGILSTARFHVGEPNTEDKSNLNALFSSINNRAYDLLIKNKNRTTPCGFLMNSEILRGWPNFAVSAESVSQTQLLPIHSIPITPSIALYLFSEKITKITLAQHKDTLHLEIKDPENLESAADSAQFAANALHKVQTLSIPINWGT